MQRLRRLVLALPILLLPLPALGVTWLCTPSQRLHCTAEGDCERQQPDIDTLSFSPEDGGLAFCRFDICFQGIAEIAREGSPDWNSLGVALVEKLPLTRDYRARALFASFEVNERRFVLSTLGSFGQDTTWFDCVPAD